MAQLNSLPYALFTFISMSPKGSRNCISLNLKFLLNLARVWFTISRNCIYWELTAAYPQDCCLCTLYFGGPNYQVFPWKHIVFLHSGPSSHCFYLHETLRNFYKFSPPSLDWFSSHLTQNIKRQIQKNMQVLMPRYLTSFLKTGWFIIHYFYIQWVELFYNKQSLLNYLVKLMDNS